VPPSHQLATDTTLHRRRHKIENMFGGLKDWRHIHIRYDRCSRDEFTKT
jgi:hypothetical protein